MKLLNLACLFSVCLLSACSTAETTEMPTAAETASVMKPIKPQPCQAMPPIRDKSKLKNNLIKSGYITVGMTDEQADAKVAEYIQMRQKAFEKCRKGK